jgi:2,3,4,5-tetrahydropyridine-2-carboxylate N-succinyltransferase
MADKDALKTTIDAAFEDRANIGSDIGDPVRSAVEAALGLLDRGDARVAAKGVAGWTVNQWLK